MGLAVVCAVVRMRGVVCAEAHVAVEGAAICVMAFVAARGVMGVTMRAWGEACGNVRMGACGGTRSNARDAARNNEWWDACGVARSDACSSAC
eukprot:54488-Pleurochrysis_carterae.AAC.1